MMHAVIALRRKLRILADRHRHRLLLGTHEGVRFLIEELGSMCAAWYRCESLDDYEANAGAKSWVNRARELTCDCEDWADLLIHRAEVVGGGGGTPHGSWIRRRFLHERDRHMRPVRRDIAIELQELKTRLIELLEQLESLRLDLVPFEPVDPRPTTRFVDVGCLVGFDGPMQDVTKMVTAAGGKADEPLKIVSIVGMAGSGKTTLAAAVYQQLQEKKCFQLYAFLSLGPVEKRMKALQSMLSELVGHPEEPLEDDYYTLVGRLTEILRDKSYLVVVDDLCSDEDWLYIKICFPGNSLGSTIITTTRYLDLANQFCHDSSHCIYNVRLLNEVDSKKLILDRAFGVGHGCPQHLDLEDVLVQITRRCSGLPLALVTIPSMIEDKFSKDDWKKLARSRWLSHPNAKVMKQTLNLSYFYLPRDLKACLLDLSIFAEDFKVDEERLVRRCIAEGYVQEMPGFFSVEEISVEEIARTYIKGLMSRNMIQLLPPVHGASRYCRLHPVIHDFLVCKSMEDNYVTLLDHQNPPASTNCSVYRRLSVQSSKHGQNLMSYDGMDLSHVRSITVFGQASTAPRLTTNLCIVRVLDLEGCVGPVCLDNLDKMPQLKYLSLKGTDVAELPATIWELRFLESLDVRSTKVKQLPPSIVGLQRSLRILLFGQEGMINSVETATRIAQDIQHCSRLQNVATIDLRVHPASFVKSLGDQLNDLRMLKITWSFHQCTEGAYRKSLLSSMAKWSKLSSLTIHCGLGCSMEFLDSLSDPPEELQTFKVTAGVFLRVPEWIERLHWLSFLQITICKIERDHLNLLGRLHLECLILGLDFVPRNAIVIESNGFKQLLRFSVNCPVPWLTFQEGSMPKLTHLELELCSGSTNPESVPSGIRYLQRLTEVVLLYNQKWCGGSSSVRMTIEAVKTEVANVKHGNPIDLFINNVKVDVQEVDEEMKSTTEIQSSDIGEEIARTTVETTQGEIEIEAEYDNIGSPY